MSSIRLGPPRKGSGFPIRGFPPIAGAGEGLLRQGLIGSRKPVQRDGDHDWCIRVGGPGKGCKFYLETCLTVGWIILKLPFDDAQEAEAVVRA